MPKVTVYVRKDDLPKWKAVDKKTEFISNALNQKPVNTVLDKMVDLGVEINKHNVRRNTMACKHGSDPQFCKHSKPGKPCK